jgi:hypothetical protein
MFIAVPSLVSNARPVDSNHASWYLCDRCVSCSGVFPWISFLCWPCNVTFASRYISCTARVKISWRFASCSVVVTPYNPSFLVFRPSLRVIYLSIITLSVMLGNCLAPSFADPPLPCIVPTNACLFLERFLQQIAILIRFGL